MAVGPTDGGAHDGTSPAACSCGAGVSCFYNQSNPGPVYGVVTELVFTPASPTTMVSAQIIGPGSGNHDSTWYDLDLSAFSTGGTITVTGTPANCAASTYLVSECFVEPAAGNFTALKNDSDVPPGTVWTLSYQFPPVTVLHLGTECNWTTPAGGTG